MKTVRLLIIALFFMQIPCENIMAQSPYKASVGAVIPYSTAIGPSFKTFFKDNVAFQTDILYKSILSGDIKNGLLLGVVVEANINIMYQKKLKEKKTSDLFWFIGGGVSGGYSFLGDVGKFGVNSIIGLEYVFRNIPLVIQLDLRPGYGLFLGGYNNEVYFFFAEAKTPFSYFDWMFGFTLRHAFKEKTKKASK
jgi:hypothetical protein